MLSLTKTMSSASAKLVATFFMVILLMLFAFAFFPNAINEFKEGIQRFLLTDFMRNPPLNAQGELLFDLLITEATIFGIIMTLIARMVVEMIAWGMGRLWRLVNPKEDEIQPMPISAAQSDKPYYPDS